MANKGRKLTKEELEQDPLLSFYQRVNQFYQRHKQFIYGGLAVVVLIIVGSVVYYNYQNKQEQKAQQLLGFAEKHFRNGEYQKALTGEGAEFTIGLENIMRQYSGTKAANLSHYYASVSEYKLGNVEEAHQYIRDFNPPEGILGVGPIAYNAMLLNELDQHEKAAQMYEKASSWDKNESTTPYNLYKAANSYFEAGNYAAAQQITDRIIEEYAQTAHADKARKLKGQMMTASSS